MDGTRKCPYCAEEIPAEAIRCRYCRSRVAALDPTRWYRDHPERRLAGVSPAVAYALAVPVVGVRLAFVVLTLLHFVGPILYLALWLLVPFAPGTPSLLERALDAARELVARLRGHDGPTAPPNADAVPGRPAA